LQFTLFAICLVFLSPTSQKFAVLFALFLIRRFLVRSIFIRFYFRYIIPKTQKYLAALFYYLFYFAFYRELFI
jgi:hypothetical protein